MPRLAAVAGFGAPNYGDLLYGLVMRRLLEPHGDIAFFGLPSRLATPLVPMRPLRELRHTKVDGVVVGGGDILRTDTHVIAADHTGRSPRASRPVRGMRRIQALAYERRHMPNHGPGPWVLDPTRLAGSAPVAYVSCALPGKVPTEIRAAFVETMEAAEYICVRDERSRQLLSEAGVAGSRINLAPDAILTIVHAFDREELQRRGESVLAAHGYTDPDAVVAVQVAPWLAPDRAHIDRLIGRLEASGRRVVGVAMGAYSGERDLLASVIAAHDRATLLPLMDAHDTAAVFATVGAVATSSFHAGMTAGVFGRRVAFAPGGERKAMGLMASIGADPSQFLASSWEDPVLENGGVFDAVRVASAAALAADAVRAAAEAVLIAGSDRGARPSAG